MRIGFVVLLESFAFDDLGGLAWLSLAEPDRLAPVEITGLRHHGRGEFTDDLLFGHGELGNGVVEHVHFDDTTDRYVVSYSSAATPSQLAVLGAVDDDGVRTPTFLTRNHVIGLDHGMRAAAA